MFTNLTKEYGDNYDRFVISLNNLNFNGDISMSEGDRTIYATDNSIYELRPFGIIFPKNAEDVEKIFTLLKKKEYRDITVTARGGGTSTNGQSINHGFIVDYSRYMHKILEVNPKEKYAWVEPGVILDTLNDHLAPHNLFFPPNISPSNRATIGGMVNTDACGKGSCIHGRTSDHILDMDLHLLNLERKTSSSAASDILQKEMLQILSDTQTLTPSKNLKRVLTGYNTERSITGKGKLDLNYLISGSEGTIGLVSKIKLKLHELPLKKRLVLLGYNNFQSALDDGIKLSELAPGAIETVDDNVINLARNDVIWQYVSHLIRNDERNSINIVEFSYSSVERFNDHLDALELFLTNGNSSCSYYHITEDSSEIKHIWNLRKKGVGLLGAMQAKRRPIPFVEDTIVPVENLGKYIIEFRAILERYGLSYGMFGHVDAGCLHVRPALDLKQYQDQTLIRNITDEVVALLKKYGGVLWGEHGKGFRSEYVEKFMGPEIYKTFQKIKTFFDPYNQLNPGKIIAPARQSIVTPTAIPGINEISTRGSLDKKISQDTFKEFENIFSCNGNALCFNFETNYVMCPSYKVSNDRQNSPKGRAMLFKEWARHKSNLPSKFSKISFGKPFKKIKNLFKKHSLEQETYEAFSHCLGCKACNTQCPIKVSIPNTKAYFLSLYHREHFRKLQDYLIGNIEKIAKWLAISPSASNLVIQSFPVRILSKHIFGITDLPRIKNWSPQPHNNKGRKVVLLRESLINYYHTNALESCYNLLTKMKYDISVSRVFENGKGLHVKGFLNKFRNVAAKNSAYLHNISKDGTTIISLDPSVSLTYSDEYKQFLENPIHLQVSPVANFLREEILSGKLPKAKKAGKKRYHLFLHCTEQSNIAGAGQIWKDIFKGFGIELNVLELGCCGMSGSFGHETEHYQDSKKLYQTNWHLHISKIFGDENNIIMASGYSCKTQLQRFGKITPKHPVEILESLLL